MQRVNRKAGQTYNVLNSGVGTNTKNAHADDEAEHVEGIQEVLLALALGIVPGDLEIHQGWEIEAETGNEESRADGQQIREERDGLSNDPGNEGNAKVKTKPDHPTRWGVDIANDVVGPDALNQIPADDNSVDTARDEDDGEGNAESNLGEKRASREQGRRLDLGADESVNDATSNGVDGDFNQAESNDGLLVVGGCVHLIHKAELAHGEAVGENDVADSNEALSKAKVLLGPARPGNSSKTTLLVARANASSNHGDEDGGADGDEIDVSKDGNLGETGRNGKEEENDGGDNAEDERAGTVAVIRDGAPHDGAGEDVGADDEDQLQNKHEADDFISPSSKHDTTNVGIVGDLRVLELGLSDNVSRVDADESHADRENNTRHHTKGSEGAGKRERAEGNGLDDEDDRQTFPAETVELGMALLGLRLLVHDAAAQAADLANMLVV